MQDEIREQMKRLLETIKAKLDYFEEAVEYEEIGLIKPADIKMVNETLITLTNNLAKLEGLEAQTQTEKDTIREINEALEVYEKDNP